MNAMTRTRLLVAPLAFAAVASGAAPAIQFEPNRGQTLPEASFVARIPQGVVYFTERGVKLRSRHSAGAVRMEFVRPLAGARWQPLDDTGETVSYHVGRNPRYWAENVPTYARLARRGVFPGVDAIFHGASAPTEKQSTARLEYDFELAPGADPARIRFRITGARRVWLDGAELVIETAGGEIRQPKPVIYQATKTGRIPRDGGFRLEGNQVSFWLGGYDASMPLTIDPTIESVAYVGGQGDDRLSVQNGNLFPNTQFGSTSSLDFAGAQGRRVGLDAFVRFNGNTGIFGGAGDDIATGATTYQFSNVPTQAVVGYTNSTDFPTQNARQPEYAGGAYDGFYIATGQGGNSISYLGSPSDDRITAFSSQSTGLYHFAGHTDGRMQNVNGADGPLGGVDIFWGSLQFINSLNVFLNLRYAGGSGDDRPLGILAYNGVIVAGETNSPDFPATGTRAGETDGFLIQYPSTSTAVNPLRAMLVGGNGADKVTAVNSYFNLGPVIAGVTSSTDLALVDPVQANYGGGASDGFWARLNTDLTVVKSSYWGGADADEATAAMLDYADNYYVGGWTRSTDFPVVNAVQPTNGGGEDGVFLHLTLDGNVHQSTYFGGSGDDRILGMTSIGPFAVQVAGVTNSRNLPKATGTYAGGATDGFEATLTAQLLSGGRQVAGSKNLLAGTSLYIPPGHSKEVVVRSADPAIALLAFTNDEAPAREITLPNQRTFYSVACLVETGTTELLLSSEGLPDARVRMDCVRPTLSVSASPTQVTAWASQQITLSASMRAYWPGSSSAWLPLAPRPNEVVQYQVRTSNPDIISLTQETGIIRPSMTAATYAVSKSIGGEADVSVSAPGFVSGPQSSVRIVVTSPISAGTSSPIPVGFQVPYTPASGIAPPGATITVTSGDPSRLVVATGPLQFGLETVHFTPASFNPTVYLQGLAPGVVPITITVPEFPPVTHMVRITRPVLNISNTPVGGALTNLTLNRSLSSTLQVSFAAEGQGISPSASPWAEAPLIRLTSSNPAVVQPEGSGEVRVTPNSSGASFRFQAVSTGTADLTITASNDPIIGPNGNTFRVTVTVPQVENLRDMEIGKDLLAGQSFRLPIPSGGPITITSTEPSRVLLVSQSVQNPVPTAQIVLPATTSPGTSPSFSVVSLTDTGSTEVIISAPDLPPARFTVRSVPSGFAWVQETINTNMLAGFQVAFPTAVPYALEPATLSPLAAQQLRPGLSATLRIQVSNPAAATLTGTDYVIANPQVQQPRLSINGAGTSELFITQPPGYRTPNIRQRLTVNVERSAVPLRMPGLLGIYTQVATTGVENLPQNLQRPITFTSSDPAKIVFSRTANAFGGGVITVNPGETFYVQSGSDRGSVAVAARMEGFNDATQPIQLAANAFTLSPSGFGSGGQPIAREDGKFYATPGGSPVTLRWQMVLVNPDSGQILSTNSALLTPNITPAVEFRSSNPAAVRVTSPPQVYNPGGFNGFEVRPVGLGEAEITPVLPPGFRLPATEASIRFVVEPPAIASRDINLGHDTMSAQTIFLASNAGVPLVNVPVTLTSTDPSRVLLSTTAQTTPAASIARTIPANSNGTEQVFVHALAGQGTVPVTLSASGYTNGTLRVNLVPVQAGFAFPGISIFPRLGLEERIAVSLQPVVPPGTGFEGFSLRAGTQPVTVTLESSDPSIFALTSSTATIAAGATGVEVFGRGLKAGETTVRVTSVTGNASVSTERRDIKIRVVQ